MIDEMLLKFGLTNEPSLLAMTDDFGDERELREYCWQVLRTYPDLTKEDWIIGIEGGDYIYSFNGNYIFITDDIWSFNLVASQAVLDLLVERIRAIR